MTDLVQKLVGALEWKLHQMDMAGDAIEAGRYDEALLHVRSLHSEARAALSAAKDGGWVLPEGKRVIVVDDSFDELVYWVDRAVSKGNANSDIRDAYEAWTGWDAWPLPNPPKGEV